MKNDTIGADATVMPEGEGTLLAERYRIVKQLGQGGMGSVWLAEDTRLDDKPFAIKMLPSILVRNKRAYRQLKDEALVAMQLVHPNIVQIRAFEENDGNPFLVMDYVDGLTLDDYLAEKGRLPETDVVRILKPVAAALDYAHAKGVVHRDVKPGNVMIAKDGTPYILDFGIAREIQETMTRVTGKLSSGTLLYMSPEQLNGAQPKPPQDVYSFAAMVYECLKGEPPFARGAIEDQIKNKQPDPLPGGPRSCAAAVMAGLAKKPEDRPASCTAVLEGSGFSRVEHVERIEENGGRSDAPLPPQGGERSRATAKVLLAVAALALVGVSGWWFESARSERSNRRTRSTSANRTERQFADVTEHAAADEAESAPKLPQKDEAAPPALPGKEEPAPASARDGGKSTAEELVARAEEAIRKSQYDDALPLLFRAKQLNPKDPAVYYHLGTLAREAYHFNEVALDNFTQASRLFALDDPRINEVRNLTQEVRAEMEASQARLRATSANAAAAAKLVAEAEGLVNKMQGSAAVKKYEAALKADPSSYPAALGLARCLSRVDGPSTDVDKAIRAYGRAIELKPEIRDNYLAAASLAYHHKRYMIEVSILTRGVFNHPENRDLLDLYIVALRKTGQIKQAQEWVEYRRQLTATKTASEPASKPEVTPAFEAKPEAAPDVVSNRDDRIEVLCYRRDVVCGLILTKDDLGLKKIYGDGLKGRAVEKTDVEHLLGRKLAGAHRTGEVVFWSDFVGHTRDVRCKEGEHATADHKKVQLWEDGPYWAETNIGAETPWDYGYYFWWGDTIGYKRENGVWKASDGSSSGFSFSSENASTYNKDIPTLKNGGWVSADNVLTPAHDAAQAHWGGGWRMPTRQDIRGLRDMCDWTWTTTNGVNGYVVHGRGDYASASIFLPCAGRGDGISLGNAGSLGGYRASVPCTDDTCAYTFGFDSSGHGVGSGARRSDGLSVRPVQGFTK